MIRDAKNTVNILIVGAGPTGLAAAALLQSDIYAFVSAAAAGITLAAIQLITRQNAGNRRTVATYGSLRRRKRTQAGQS